MAKLIIGVNDLATTHPDLAAQWHPTKNGSLTPQDVTAGSGINIWWIMPYDEPKTGKHFNFEWPAIISNRAYHNSSCPYLSIPARTWPGFNDLATTHPELASQWHPSKNRSLTPRDVSAGSQKSVWWYLPYDDSKTGKHFNFEWSSKIVSRTLQNQGCPFLSKSNTKVWLGFNDLLTTNPEIASQWHPTKNGTLTPQDVSAGCRKEIQWFLPYDDPNTGKHFDFEWTTSVNSRTSDNLGCPYLSNKAVWPGFNDLATTHPEIAAQWHPTKNGVLNPQKVTAGCMRKVWWYLPYDDPKTGKHFDFEWPANINDRIQKNTKCPYLSGQAVWPGFNDLATTNPEIAAQWHPTKNGNLTPMDVATKSGKKVWWLNPCADFITGEFFDFEWPAIISGRTKGSNCPYLSYSSTEKLTYSFLKNMNINFETEKQFKETGTLCFDFYIPSMNVIIEPDGIHHFKNIYNLTEKQFNKNKRSDCIKNHFCHKNNIAILRIPHIYDAKKDADKIQEMILQFLKNKYVPDEILDFYVQHEGNNYSEIATKLNILNHSKSLS